ncbi:MAG: hypothetical protein RL562_1105 [Planctomycetota bacterium]
MPKTRLLASSLLCAALAGGLAHAQEPENPRRVIHSVSDISQEFSFYMDGRFYQQYLAGHGRDARNWGSLHRVDLSNVNLLVLTGGDPRIPYTAASLDHVDAFLEGGGTVLLMIDGAESMPPGASLALRHGVEPTLRAAKAPIRVTEALTRLHDGADVDAFRDGRTLACGEGFEHLVVDADGEPVLTVRKVGEGHLIVGSRSLFGSRPDASDPIHADWITPMLLHFATQKPVVTRRHHPATWVEHAEDLGPLVLEYHDGTAPFARAIADEYITIRPHLVAITGVEPAPGMIKRLLILPTGGGGFSSGERIAIGAFWGDFPKNRYPMVELIGHEAGHSWVLPHPEPLWNEPIATWLGIQVGRRMGLPEADKTLERQIRLARRFDPDLTKVDPLAEDAPRDLVWGKSYFVFEELERLHGPGAMARYFRTKREMLASDRKGYSFDDLVAVWSKALGEDMFPWFQGLGFGVERSNTDLSDE